MRLAWRGQSLQSEPGDKALVNVVRYSQARINFVSMRIIDMLPHLNLQVYTQGIRDGILEVGRELTSMRNHPVM